MSLPNGPKSPAIWQMLQWLATPVAFMRACRDRHGDCFTVTFAKRCPPTVFCSHPNDLQLLLSSDDAGPFEAPGHLDDELEPLLGPQSLMALSGDRHRRMRQLLMPPFHGERMRSYGQLIGDITAEVMGQ